MILMGSNYFFRTYKDFKSHDVDYIDIVDTNEFKEKRIIRGQGKDYFYLKKKSKDDLIADALKSTDLPMVVGKFLIPEFNNKIGFRISDLPKVKPLIDILDKKHEYEKLIYEFYLQNKGFFLTREQRDLAYASYKETRKVKTNE